MSLARQYYTDTERRSPFVLDWQARDVGLIDPVNRTTGALQRTKARTGQVGTFTRTSNATAVDARGATYTAPERFAAYQWTGGRAGLLIRPADSPRTVESLSFPVASRIVAHTGYVRFVERGTAGVTSGRVVHWGAADNSNPRLLVYAASSRYTVAYNSGTQTLSQMGVGTTPTAGDLVELWWQVTATGAVQIRQRLNGGDVVSATASGANATPPPLAASGQLVWLGTRGTSDVGNAEFQVLRIHPDPEASLGLMQAGSGLVVPGSGTSPLVVDLLSQDPDLHALVEVSANEYEISD